MTTYVRNLSSRVWHVMAANGDALCHAHLGDVEQVNAEPATGRVCRACRNVAEMGTRWPGSRTAAVGYEEYEA